MAWALVLAVGAPGAHAQSGCPSPNPASDYNCPVGPDYLIPGLTDLAGWNHRASYHNILYGDIDGDRVDEMVARGTGGIQVYRFDSTAGQWTQLKMLTEVLSDRQGWGPGAPHYYDTIRLGDLDGDGTAELVARASNGIIVYGFSKGTFPDTGAWTPLDAEGPMADGTCFNKNANCWKTDASYYSTIQLTPIGRTSTSKPTMQLMGRGGDGLELYSWNGKNKGWTKLSTLTALSDDHSYRDPQYYSTLISWDQNTLFARDPGGMQYYKYTPGAGGGTWQLMPTKDRPFAGSLPESRYGTIQAIRGFKNSNGVGETVVMGRSAGGLVFYELTGGGTDWNQVSLGDVNNNKLFPDGPGWNKPRYYRTIKAVDLDGDGTDEILARAGDGLLTWTLYGCQGCGKYWKPQSVDRPALADDLWANPAYYRTIQTARLVPKSKVRSLMARGPSGVRTWLWDTKTDRWVRYQRYGTFKALDPDAYDDISFLLTIDQDIRSIYGTSKFGTPENPNPTETNLRTYGGTLQDLCGLNPEIDQPYKLCPFPTPLPPRWKTVSQKAWSDAVNQINSEINAALEVLGYFKQVLGLQTSLFDYQNRAYGDITTDLKLDQAKNVSTRVNYLELFEGILDILAEIPGLGEVFGVTGGALGIADSASIEASGPPAFDTTAANLGDYLNTMQTKALIATGSHQKYVLGDGGLMATVGRLSESNVWTLNTDAAQSAGRQGFTKWVYQEYLPVLWDRWNVTNCLIAAQHVDEDEYCAKNGPTMNSYVVRPRGGGNGNAVDFDGLLPRQNACPWYRRCEWASLQFQNFGDVADILTKPVTDACRQEWVPGAPAMNGQPATDGCALGISLPELESWKFRSYKCDDYYDGGAGTGCHTAQPTDVVAGDAAGLGSRRGKVNLAIVAPLGRDLDLRRARITLGHLLHDGSGAGELVNRRPGRDLAPVTLRVKRGGRRHRARFETPRGRRPRIRGTISVVTRKVRVRRGRGRKTRRARKTRLVRTLRVRLRVDRAHLDRPRNCGGNGTAHLGVHLLVRPRRGRRHAQVLGMEPWACMKGGRLRYRHPRSVARVRRAKAAVSRGGVASIPLRCSSSGLRRCPGSVVLSARLGGARRLVIGRRGFSISAGNSRAGRYRDAHSESIRVRLSARARAALAANGRLKVTASVRTGQPSGAVLVTRRLVLVAR